MNSLSAPSDLAETVPPVDALRLGYAGLIPFAVGAALLWITRGEAHLFAAHALSAYAATILSFLGGIHWGLAMRHDERGAMRPHARAVATHFGWGVAPSLVAWMALMMRPDAGLVLQGVLLVVCYLVDRRVYPQFGSERWLTLRFRLSSVAALCCFLGAAAA